MTKERNWRLSLAVAMRDFALEIDVVAMVRVRADDEKAARKVVPAVLRAPDATEVGLANQNNAALGQFATVTSVDVSIGSVKSSKPE